MTVTDVATNGKTRAVVDKAPPPPLPKSLVQALPAAGEIVKYATEIEALIPKLRKQMDASKQRGAIDLARAFTVLHRLVSVVDAKLKPMTHLFEHYKVLVCPEVFEQAGVSHIPLDAGYRVTISYTLRASVNGDDRTAAYAWLKKHHPDTVIETVNASTLSKLARELLEQENRELPEKLFKVVNVPNTSVTRT